MRTRLPAALLALGFLALAAGPASAATKKPIYVSLGDSLAFSYTKNADGSPGKSDKGYTELLAAKARTSKRYGRKLTVKKFGCPGENTASYLGITPRPFGGAFDCRFKKSQHADSIRFIKKHRKRIGFVSLAIGANNFTPCSKGTAVEITCVQKGNLALDRHLPKIYRELRKATGKKVPIVVINLYDPYLALYLQGAEYRELALLTVDLARQVANTIENLAAKQKIRTADTFRAFKTAQTGTQTPVNGVQVPVAVAQLCAYTFMCQPPPVGPDIHPNDAGYAAIATTIAKVLKVN